MRIKILVSTVRQDPSRIPVTTVTKGEFQEFEFSSFDEVALPDDLRDNRADVELTLDTSDRYDLDKFAIFVSGWGPDGLTSYSTECTEHTVRFTVHYAPTADQALEVIENTLEESQLAFSL